ncbi:MAG: hypothetical protein JJT95_11130 [Pararhodobacter sp.]|nr:hypothetical protein [Pararhodobacter sp.]
MSTLYLCAAGNPEGVRLALEVNEAAGRWQRIVLLDDEPSLHGQEILGVRVVGPFAALAGHEPGDEAVNLVARTARGRDGARAKIEGFGISLASLIHPTVNLRGATLGRAVTLYEGCVISALSSLGDHAVVFTRAVLGHGASLGAGATLAPGAVVNARVRVGARAYIGTNAAVLPDLAVGEDATVSACSAVVGDVPAGCTALGVPAEIMGGNMGAAVAPAPCGGDAASADEVRAVFAEVLGLPAVGGDAGFFDSGGNSKLALELQRLLGQRLGVAVSIVDIFRYPSPARLAAHLFAGAGPPAQPGRAELIRRRRARRG